jgi:flagellar hook-associated protein 3 FlgL
MSAIGSPTLSSGIGVLPSSNFTQADSIGLLDSQQATMATLEQQVSSGLAFSKPSDDPAGVVQAMQLQSALSRAQTYTSTVASATSYVSQANNVLTAAGTSLQSLRTLVLQASNSGTQSAATLAGYATQATAIGQTLASGAATTVDGLPVFAASQQTRTVAAGTTIPVGVTAGTAYGTGATSLQSVVAKIASDLSSGAFSTGTTAADDLAALDTATTAVTSAAATVGTQFGSLQHYATQATTNSTALQAQLTSVQDVNPAQAIAALQQAQTDYQTSMWATTQILSQSLVEFLK